MEDLTIGGWMRTRVEGPMRKARAWINSPPGRRVAGLVVYGWFATGIMVSHTETYGVGLLPVFVLAGVSGLAAFLGTGPLLSTARLLNGGAALFVSGILFLQGTYIAADFDRTAAVQSLGVLGVVLVVNTLVCEFRIARARVRSDHEAARRDAGRHAELLEALQQMTREQVHGEPPVGLVITLRLPARFGSMPPRRSGVLPWR